MNKQVILNSYISLVNSSSFYTYDLSEVNGTMDDQAIVPSSPWSHKHLGHHTHQSLWHNVYTLGPQKKRKVSPIFILFSYLTAYKKAFTGAASGAEWLFVPMRALSRAPSKFICACCSNTKWCVLVDVFIYLNAYHSVHRIIDIYRRNLQSKYRMPKTGRLWVRPCMPRMRRVVNHWCLSISMHITQYVE